MDTRENAILSTLRYFDGFDFAPTLLEVEKWLFTNESSKRTLGGIQSALDSNPDIKEHHGFYFFSGREELVQLRKQKYDYTDTKWKHAKPFLKILAMMPHVQAIWFANSMGWGNARKTSDIDLVIVTDPNHIWSSRFFTTTLMKLFRQRPHEQTEDKALCLSFYMTKDHLNLEQYKIGEQDIHFTFWATQYYPVYDPDNLFEEYKKENRWAEESFADLHWTTGIPRRSISLSRAGKAIQRLLEVFTPEQLLKRIQLRVLPQQLKEMANKDNRVVMNDNILKLHTNDTRQEQQAAWEAQQ